MCVDVLGKIEMKKWREIFHLLSNYICPIFQLRWWFPRYSAPSASPQAIASKKIISYWDVSRILPGDIWKLHFSQFITSNETINIINSSGGFASFLPSTYKCVLLKCLGSFSLLIFRVIFLKPVPQSSSACFLFSRESEGTWELCHSLSLNFAALSSVIKLYKKMCEVIVRVRED